MRNPRCTGALVLVLVLALVLGACGGSSDGVSTEDFPADSSPRRTTSTTTAETEPDPGGPGGACIRLNEAADQLQWVPLFLQIKSPENVVAIRNHLLGNLDLDKFFRAMVTLHYLDGSTSPLGDPRDAINVYEKAAVDAKALFVIPAPDQPAINAYLDSLGDPGLFLSHQTPISAALTEAGC